MLGTLVNTGTVLTGSLAGLALRRVIRKPVAGESPVQRIVMQGIGLNVQVQSAKSKSSSNPRAQTTKDRLRCLCHLGFGICLTFVLWALAFWRSPMLTLLAGRLQFLIETRYLAELTAVGGIIILGIGIRLFGLKDIKAANFLPALVFVVLIMFIALRLNWIR